MKGISFIGIITFAAACAVFAATNIPQSVSSPAAAVQAVSEPQPEVLHQVLGLVDQNRLDEASVLFETVRNTAGTSPMGKYLVARLAFERGQYTEALQHLSQVMLSGGRNSEWLPAAVFLEGMIYKKNGQPEAAAYAAEELVLGWPESVWARRRAELN